MNRSLMAAIASCGALALSTAGTANAIDAPGGLITFSSYSGAHSQIFVGSGDGKASVAVTHDPVDHFEPSISPDRTKIAYVTMDYDTNKSQLVVANTDGSSPVVLKASSTEAFDNPAWSPEGSTIAFTKGRGTAGPSNGLFTINPDGTGLSTVIDDGAYNDRASWSPDGKQLTFQSDETGTYEIYAINADGTGARQLTDAGRNYITPSWSPRGDKIAFSTAFGPLHTMNTDGTRIATLGGSRTAQATWSPDSGKIMYLEGFKIHVTNADGTGDHAIATPPSSSDPDWSHARSCRYMGWPCT